MAEGVEPTPCASIHPDSVFRTGSNLIRDWAEKWQPKGGRVKKYSYPYLTATSRIPVLCYIGSRVREVEPYLT